jgi:hypothetical protein
VAWVLVDRELILTVTLPSRQECRSHRNYRIAADTR